MQPLYPVISFKAALAGFRELGLDTEALLAATGVGLGLFGVYSFVEARFRRVQVRLPG